MSEFQPSTIPVTIIGGYLGAGKTTLVNHLLRNADGRKLAILVNEFGELPIDADLIEAEEDDLISLAGGCICCSYGNDMMRALEKLSAMMPQPDHVVLEASGVAIPAMIAGSISLLPGFSLDGIVVLTDALNIQEQAADTYMSDTISRQLEDADIIILNKADLLTDVHLNETHEWLAKQTSAKIIPAHNAKVPLQIALQDFDRDETVSTGSQQHALNDFVTETIAPSIPVDAKTFGLELIENIPGLIRAKGFVEDADGTMKTLQIVGKRLDVSPAPPGIQKGVVLIRRK